MTRAATFDPFAAAAIDDPYPQYHRLREVDPVHWSEKLRSWILFRHDDVAAFFRDDERLSSDKAKTARFAGGGASGLQMTLRTVASDPPEHTAVRAVLNSCLGPRVRAVAARVDTVVNALLDRMHQQDEGDLISAFAYPLPITVIADLLNIPEQDRAQFQASSHAIARGMDRFYSGSDASRGLKEIGAYFLQLLQKRQGSAGDDMISELSQTEHDGDRLNQLEVVAMCTAMVFGGHETTVNLIGNGMLALLQRPQQMEELRRGAVSIDSAVEELLRFDSPAQFISRAAKCDFEWHGRTIRTGESVLAGLGSANRDAAIFHLPDELDLLRDPNPHLAFGLGTHFCPGAQLSRLEARIAISALLHRYPNIRLGSRAPSRRHTVILRGLECLPVQLTT